MSVNYIKDPIEKALEKKYFSRIYVRLHKKECDAGYIYIFTYTHARILNLARISHDSSQVMLVFFAEIAVIKRLL